MPIWHCIWTMDTLAGGWTSVWMTGWLEPTSALAIQLWLSSQIDRLFSGWSSNRQPHFLLLRQFTRIVRLLRGVWRRDKIYINTLSLSALRESSWNQQLCWAPALNFVCSHFQLGTVFLSIHFALIHYPNKYGLFFLSLVANREFHKIILYSEA
jgi:hypothetical protein